MKKTSPQFYSLSVVILMILTTSLISCEKNDDGGWHPKDHSNCPDANSVIAEWPTTSKMVAQEIIAEYGQPNGVLKEMLVWNHPGPWKKTIVFRDTIAHNFPTPHPDLLQQFIDYKVPTEKFDDMANYDGSVILERTKGEMSARCDKEGANFLAINLANDVATSAKTIDQARAYYVNAMKAFKTTGKVDIYMQGFQFTLPTGGTSDPDVKKF